MQHTANCDFRELMYNNTMTNGFDPTLGQIISILFVSPEAIALEDISKETGFSLSATSKNLKFLSNINMVKRIKKPGTKKVYFFMEKDLFNSFLLTLKKKKENIIGPSLQKLPEIIKKYKEENSSNDELKIAELYYQQILAFGKAIESVIETFKKEMENIK